MTGKPCLSNNGVKNKPLFFVVKYKTKEKHLRKGQSRRKETADASKGKMPSLQEARAPHSESRSPPHCPESRFPQAKNLFPETFFPESMEKKPTAFRKIQKRNLFN